MMPHSLVAQLRFTRSEFQRGLVGLDPGDACKRLLPMNCISWNVGHLAWQEQRYFLTFAQGKLLMPELNREFAYGAPASTPALEDMQRAWQAVTRATDLWLDTLTTAGMQQMISSPAGDWTTSLGNLVQRVIYHYWYHTGENMAMRQMLGHTDLEDFVGNLDEQAPYRPD